MRLTHVASVSAPLDRVWALVMDVPAAARCVKGVSSVIPLGDDRYRGTLAVQLGPVRLALDGDVALTAKDPASSTASLRAAAKDSRLGGAIRATLDLRLAERGDTTDLFITTDLQVMGRIGEFGQPIIKRKADQLMQDFADCLARSLIGGTS